MFRPQILPRLLSSLLLLILATDAVSGFAVKRNHVHEQEVLQSSGLIMPSKQQKIQSSRFLDAVPGSIGVLITTPGGEEEEIVHLWLPIGERVYTRHHALLPLHPLNVRVTTLVAVTPEHASPEYLGSIECRIFPGFNGPMQLVDRTKALPTEFAAKSFYKGDGSVQVGSLFGVDGWEVEAYECSEREADL